METKEKIKKKNLKLNAIKRRLSLLNIKPNLYNQIIDIIKEEQNKTLSNKNGCSGLHSNNK